MSNPPISNPPTTNPLESNPLLQSHRLPPFSSISAQHVLPAVKTLVEQNESALEQQLSSLGNVTWQSLVEPIEERDDRLAQAWSPVSHLNSVMNNDELRAAYDEAQQVLTAYETRVGQNKPLYHAYEQLQASEAFSHLSRAQQKVIKNAVRDFRLSGVALEGADKTRFGEIRAELSSLTTRFANNVLDATQGWYKHVTDENELAGLSEMAISGARKAAKDRELDGYVFTLDIPVYLDVMTFADNRQLRRELYTAFATRASDQGPDAGRWDNSELMEKILPLRQELAALLGFNNYAELSIAPKMAQSTEQVVTFLTELAEKSRPYAQRELDELRQYARDNFNMEDLEAWDVPYFSEKLKQQKFQVSQEEIRQYFPAHKVIEGLFNVVQKLYGLEIQPKSDVEKWHADVQYYEILKDGKQIASFYFDLYARAKKRGGAWMADCRVRRQTKNGLQLPVAFLICNFNAPVGEKPALLTHNEVTTLFHEFGHGLHHMLTKIDIAAVSGINGVAWDAVELPSQFMENFCWQKEVLQFLSGHYQTGEPLPENLLDKLLAGKNFQAAMQMLRQLEFSLFDFRLHMEYGSENFAGVQALLDEVRNQVAVFVPPPFNKFQNSFTHIFAGGYAAGYYSYKWAEVLSADAFAAFEENGIFDESTGRRFLTEVLEKGGSEDAMELFKNFRGREPSPEALLKHSGIAA